MDKSFLDCQVVRLGRQMPAVLLTVDTRTYIQRCTWQVATCAQSGVATAKEAACESPSAHENEVAEDHALRHLS